MSHDQAQAMLFGLALGDSLGKPTEFLQIPQIKAAYGRLGIQAPPDPALYTDDTQMTLAVAEGLLDAGLDADLDMRMEAIGQRLVKWVYSRENNRATGITSTSGVERFQSGLPWRESGLAESKGCGSAIRVAAVGYFYQYDEARLKEMAEASSLITHRHPAAVTAAIAAAYLVKLALDGAPVSEYSRRTMEFVDGLSDEFDAAIYRVGHAAAWTDEESALEHIGRGWRGDEAVALALYCVLRYPDDYAACARRAANTNGDSDSIACIAGGIMGARLGLEAIPAEWRLRCENVAYLQDLGSVKEQLPAFKGVRLLQRKKPTKMVEWKESER